jgi:hypothetical protein
VPFDSLQIDKCALTNMVSEKLFAGNLKPKPNSRARAGGWKRRECYKAFFPRTPSVWKLAIDSSPEEVKFADTR